MYFLLYVVNVTLLHSRNPFKFLDNLIFKKNNNSSTLLSIINFNINMGYGMVTYLPSHNNSKSSHNPLHNSKNSPISLTLPPKR